MNEERQEKYRCIYLNETGYIPAPWGVQTDTERSEVGANTPLLQSRRQMANGI